MLSVSFKVISKRVVVLQIRYFLKRFQKKMPCWKSFLPKIKTPKIHKSKTLFCTCERKVCIFLRLEGKLTTPTYVACDSFYHFVMQSLDL